MKKVLLFFIFAVIIISVISAEEVSDKKEIAVFSLSYSDWSIPADAFGLVDERLIGVFAGLGRFNVETVNHRLGTENVSGLISKIIEVNDSTIVGEEAYILGEQTFTKNDIQFLSEFDLIVIPSLSFYDSIVVDSDGQTEWEVELQTVFSIIRTEDSDEASIIKINTFGSGDTEEEAARNASDAVSSQLDFELRSIEEFQLRAGILEVMSGGRVILELGSDMGLRIGDEFRIVKSRITSTGDTVEDKIGLLVVTDIRKELSYALIIYNDEAVIPGAEIREFPRFGADVSVYARGFFDAEGFTGGTAGVRSVFAAGFYDFRPLLGFEVPLVAGFLDGQWPGLPLSVYGGAELLWYIGRLQIEPSVVLGATALIPVNETDEFVMTHIGGIAALTLNWMCCDDIRLFAEGGYSYWFSIAPSSLIGVSAFGGIFGGLGVTIKL